MGLLASGVAPHAKDAAVALLPKALGTGNTPLTIEFSGTSRDGHNEHLPPGQVATRSQWFTSSWDVEFAPYRNSPVTTRDLVQGYRQWGGVLPLQGRWLSGKATDKVVDLRPGVSCAEAWQRNDPPGSIAIIGRIPGRPHGQVPDALVLSVSAGLFSYNSGDYCSHLAFLSSSSWPKATWGPPIPYKPAWAFGSLGCYCPNGWNDWLFRRDHAVFTIPLTSSLTPQSVSVSFHAYDKDDDALHEWHGTINVLPPSCPLGAAPHIQGAAAQPAGQQAAALPRTRTADRVGCLYGVVAGRVSWQVGRGVRIGDKTFYPQSGDCNINLLFKRNDTVEAQEHFSTESSDIRFFTSNTGEVTQEVHSGDITVNQRGNLIENDAATYAWWNTIPIPAQGRITTYIFDSRGLRQQSQRDTSNEEGYCAPQVRMAIGAQGLQGSIAFTDKGPSHPPGPATFSWKLHR